MKRRSRPSASMVVAIVALILATTGSAVAAKHYFITRSSQVKPGALSVSDLSASARRALRGNQGPRGFQGLQGPQGDPGPAGIASITRVNGPAVAQGASGSGTEVQTSTATCPGGSFVTGGGYDISSIDNIPEFAQSSATQYSVIAVNESSFTATVQAQAICVSGAGVTAARVRSTKTPASVLSKARALQARLNARRH